MEVRDEVGKEVVHDCNKPNHRCTDTVGASEDILTIMRIHIYGSNGLMNVQSEEQRKGQKNWSTSTGIRTNG